MASNIYDTANQLENELRQNETYVNLKESFKTIQEDNEANTIYQNFRSVQTNLQQKQMSGQEITEEEVQEAQEMAMKASDNEKIKTLMEAEQQLSTLIDDLNRVIMKPIQDLYQG